VCCLCVLFGTFSTVSVTSEKRQSIVGFEMFKKFIREENVISNSQVKSSVARGIRSSLVGQMHDIGEVIDDIIPKKQPLVLAKCSNHVSLVVVNSEPVFFNERDGPFFPTLRLLHKYPFMLRHVQVDRGAIKFVLQGANVMCP